MAADLCVSKNSEADGYLNCPRRPALVGSRSFFPKPAAGPFPLDPCHCDHVLSPLPLGGRALTGTELEGDRPNLYRLTLRLIEDAPWLGHGLGAFDAAFRPYRDASLPRPVGYDFAHQV